MGRACGCSARARKQRGKQQQRTTTPVSHDHFSLSPPSLKARITALKAAAKVTRAAETAARRATACARIDVMSPEEKAAWRDAKSIKQAARRAETAARHARLDAAQAAAAPVPHVIIDLCPAYDALMTPRERSSLASQLRACYAANAASAHPLRLTFAGFSPAWEAALGGPSSGMHAWRVGRTAADYLAAAAEGGQEGGAPRRAVYLSADAPAQVDILEPGVAYVIGGLVDRNRHKGVAASRAASAASSSPPASSATPPPPPPPPPGVTVSAACLPIGAHLATAAGAVLTVDQVARLLVRWWEERENGGGGGAAHAWWATAVEEAVPARKRRKVGGEGGEDGEEDGSET